MPDIYQASLYHELVQSLLLCVIAGCQIIISFFSLTRPFFYLITASITSSTFLHQNHHYRYPIRKRCLAIALQSPNLSTCVSRSLSVTPFAVAFTTAIPLIPAQPMAVMMLRSEKSSWAIRVLGIQRQYHSHQAGSLLSRTRATLAKATKVRITKTIPKVFVGDVPRRTPGWRFWRMGTSAASSQAGSEERRWQYATRVSASVFGPPVGLP